MIGLMELVLAHDGDLWGILAGLTQSTGHPSRTILAACKRYFPKAPESCLQGALRQHSFERFRLAPSIASRGACGV